MSRSKAIAGLLLLVLLLAVWLSVRNAGHRANEQAIPDLKSQPSSSDALLPAPGSLASESPASPPAAERTVVETPAVASSKAEAQEGFKLFVRVVQAPQNTPIADAVFVVLPSLGGSLAHALAGKSPPGLTPVRVHPDGLYELDFYADRALVICVRAPACAARALFATRGHERPEDAALIALERSGTLALHLTDRAKAAMSSTRVRVTAPVAGMFFDALNSEPPSLDELDWSGETDAAGRVELSGMPPRVPLAISVAPEGQRTVRRSESITLEPGERREVELEIGGTAIVRGRMIDELDVPVAAREVWLVEVDPRFLDTFDAGTRPQARATTDGDGAFHFDAVREGLWRVGPAFVAPGSPSNVERLSAKVERVEVGAQTELVELTLHVLRGLFVSGVVLDASDAPVTGCVVRISQKDGERSWVKSDARGEFQLGPLASGLHQLVSGSSGAGVWSESAPVDVLAGTRGVVLRANLGATLHGRILGTGDKLVGGMIEVAMIEGGELEAAWAPVATSGSFKLQGLNAGTYDVIVVSRGSQVCSARVELAEGEQHEVELRLQAGATLVLENHSGEAMSIELRSEGRFLGLHPLGTLSPLKLSVPTGTLELRFLGAQQQRVATQSVTLGAGEERRVSHPPQ